MFELAKLTTESKRCVSMFRKLGIFFRETIERNSGGFRKQQSKILWIVRNPPPNKDKDPNFSFGRLSKLLHYFFYHSVTTLKPLPVRFFVLF